MKTMKRISGLLLALALVLALAVPGLATAGSGSITIQNNGDTGASVTGRTFVAYRILDVSLAADGTPSYTVPSSMKTFYASYFDLTFTNMTPGQIDAAVIAEINALSENNDKQAFAEAALAAAKDSGIPTVNITAGTKTDAPFGYYVIEDTTSGGENFANSRVSSVMLDTTIPNVTITLKADKPSIDKKIVTGAEGGAVASNGSIGDTVKFQITGKVPDMQGFEKYVYFISDTLSDGLTLIDDEMGGFKVTVNGVELARTAAAANTDNTYHVEKDDQTFRIIFHNFIENKALSGEAIVVTYSATINDEALIGNKGNPNEAYLSYSNNPLNEGEGDPNDPDGDMPTGESPKMKTITYVTAIELLKYEEGESSIKLAGAEFMLEGSKVNKVKVTKDEFVKDPDADPAYYLLKSGDYTKTPSTEDTEQYYEDAETKYKRQETVEWNILTEEISATGTTNADGLLTFTGLAEGTYIITELKAPNGYNLLAAPITVVITCDEPTAIIGNDTECTWKFKVDGKAEETAKTGIVKIEVPNAKGGELPSTGGMGTTLFTIGGIVLMVGAAVVLAIRRRGAKTEK